jgi:hypothetical protein
MTREEYEQQVRQYEQQYRAQQNEIWKQMANQNPGVIGSYIVWPDSDSGDETDPKPVNEVYAPTETEEEKQSRLWKLIQEFSTG